MPFCCWLEETVSVHSWFLSQQNHSCASKFGDIQEQRLWDGGIWSRHAQSKVLATSHVWPSERLKISSTLKFRLLSCTSHILSIQQAHVASGCHTGPQGYRMFPSSWIFLLTETGLHWSSSIETIFWDFLTVCLSAKETQRAYLTCLQSLRL